MNIPGVTIDLQAVLAPVPIWRARVTADDWRATAFAVREAGGRLLALWGGAQATGPTVCVAYVTLDGLVWLELPLDGEQTTYPDLVPFFPAAARMQRAAADLSGIRASGTKDQRPWLNHGAWPAEFFPLRHGTDASQ
ncbi:NADH-quinone oxidoreductase subunit C, partial [Rhodoferax sp.]|uniref:NADH-quinone oxidoreductase subunit C n=1 Tax=Rhodoferax sp. TaxID=50421 RepID=UPI00272202EA